jgi:hypothetical protein
VALILAVLSGGFVFYFTLRPVEVVLMGDGKITARGRFWQVESCAKDVYRLRIDYAGEDGVWRRIHVPESRFRLPVTQAMAVRLLELNPRITVRDGRLPRDRGTSPR